MRIGPIPSRLAGTAVPATVIALLLGAALVASGSIGAGEPSAPQSTPGTGGGAVTSEPTSTAAVAAVEEVAADFPDTTFAVSVADRVTGQLASNAAGTAPMYSASLVKIVLAVDVLQRRRDGVPVGARDLALIPPALGPSDDQAMNLLWSRFDGPEAVSRVAGRLGLTATRPPADPSQWGETPVSARDVVVVFRHVLGTMHPADRELMMGALATAPPVADDGFDQIFGLRAVAPDPAVAAKQGWMCCTDDRIKLHSAGTLGEQRRFIVALLSRQPAERSYDEAREVATAAAAAVAEALP